MAFGQDVLATALQDLKKGYEELFTLSHPILKAIVDRGDIEKYKLQGPYREFTVLTGGPGDDIAIRFGPETLGTPRYNNALRGNESGARSIYVFGVPGKDFAEVGGSMDMGGIIKKYPDAAVADMRERFARQLARGAASAGSDPAGANCNGFTTLNGSQSYNPQGTSRTGIFQHVVPASQTGTVHGLPLSAAASSPTPGWYHQYDHTTSFGLDGLKKLRTLATTAAQQGAELTGGTDLLLGDSASYQNYLEAESDKVIVLNAIDNPAARYIRREGVKFGEFATFWWEPAIDITDTTAFSAAVTQEGVIYGLCTADWEWFTVGNNPKMASSGNWEVQGPIQIPDQDMWQYRLIIYGNLNCQNLRRQFEMTGGANS